MIGDFSAFSELPRLRHDEAAFLVHGRRDTGDIKALIGPVAMSGDIGADVRNALFSDGHNRLGISDYTFQELSSRDWEAVRDEDGYRRAMSAVRFMAEIAGYRS
jgi:hypothetical protein